MTKATGVSKKGALQIAQREAFVPVAYRDGWFDPKTKKKPRWSIGFGDNSAKEGDTITVQEALIRFRRGLDERTAIILKKIKRDLSQQQLDAVSSLFYQGGNLKLDPMAALVNANCYTTAELLFLDDAMATNKDGEFMSGLKSRRERENKIWKEGDYGDIGWFWKYQGDPARGVRHKHYIKEEEMV